MSLLRVFEIGFLPRMLGRCGRFGRFGKFGKFTFFGVGGRGDSAKLSDSLMG